MGFQIRNKANEPVTINDLDKEAAAFWGVELDERHYAAPTGCTSWFESIGLYIHMQRPELGEVGEVHVEWCNVVGLMMGYTLLGQNSDDLKASIDRYWANYIGLIRHWSNLGYKAYAITE